MLDKEFDSFINVEAALEEAAEYKLIYDSDNNWYHNNHLFKDFDKWLEKELTEYSKENLEYHLKNYKVSFGEDKYYSRVILLYYRDAYMSQKEKILLLPVELLFAKT